MNAGAPILVCFAVPEEARPFRPRIGGLPPVRILVTGMGWRNAAATIEAAFHHTTPACVITSGFTGGLDPGLRLADVLFDADAGFPGTARLLAAGARAGRFHCADRVAVTREEKRQLRAQTGADAVEMESEPIRTFCRGRGVPSATVRVVSDTAAEDLPLDFNQLVGPNWRMDYAKLALALVAAPGKIPELMRFRRRLDRAARALAQALWQAMAE